MQVLQQPLAVCDERSVPESDRFLYELRFPDRTGENYSLTLIPTLTPTLTLTLTLRSQRRAKSGHVPIDPAPRARAPLRLCVP